MQKRILIIEGAEDVRDSAQAALEQRDVEVIVAGVGRQGVYLAERRQPDAILVATHMPDIDGPRIVRELRANPSTRDIPVIFLEDGTDIPLPDGGSATDGSSVAGSAVEGSSVEGSAVAGSAAEGLAPDGGPASSEEGVVGAVPRSLDASHLAERVQQLLGW